MRKNLFVLALLALAGCATDYLATGLPMLEGKPASEAVRYFGPPAQENKVSGKTVYVWTSEEKRSYYVPESALGPNVIRHDSVAVYPGSSAYYTERVYTWRCRLEVEAQKGIITHTRYEGDPGGCRTFSEKIRPLAKTLK